MFSAIRRCHIMYPRLLCDTLRSLTERIQRYPTLSYAILHYRTLYYALLRCPSLPYAILRFLTLAHAVLCNFTMFIDILPYSPFLSMSLSLSISLLSRSALVVLSLRFPFYAC